jgi:hypothetical protein
MILRIAGTAAFLELILYSRKTDLLLLMIKDGELGRILNNTRF